MEELLEGSEELLEELSEEPYVLATSQRRMMALMSIEQSEEVVCAENRTHGSNDLFMYLDLQLG